MPESEGGNSLAVGNPPRINIFQMDHDQLRNLHQILWARQKPSGQLSARTLRIRATEWLLLNGLSTMHRFEKRNGDGEEMRGDLNEECNTCRQYRVGKSIPIYEELAAITKRNENQQNGKQMLIGHQPIQNEENGQNGEIGTPGTGKATIYATSWENSFGNANANGSSSYNSQNHLLIRNSSFRNGTERRPPRISNMLFGCLWCRRG